MIFLGLMIILSSLTSQAQLLWKVSGSGIKGNSYLFGTEHVVPGSFLNEVRGFDEALKQCDVMYGEVTQSDMTSPESMQKLMQLSMAPADSTLSVVLNKEQLAKLEKLLQQYISPMVTVATVDGMKPMALTAQLTLKMILNEFPEMATMGEVVDMAAQSRAKALNKPCRGFETTIEQAELLFGAPISSQTNQLIKLLDNPDKEMAELKSLTAAYKSQDFDKLEKTFLKSMAEDDAQANALVYRRNENWTKVMMQVMPKESMLVVVGAGHLCGEKGLITLLRNAGYEVTAVK